MVHFSVSTGVLVLPRGFRLSPFVLWFSARGKLPGERIGKGRTAVKSFPSRGSRGGAPETVVWEETPTAVRGCPVAAYPRAPAVGEIWARRQPLPLFPLRPCRGRGGSKRQAAPFPPAQPYAGERGRDGAQRAAGPRRKSEQREHVVCRRQMPRRRSRSRGRGVRTPGPIGTGVRSTPRPAAVRPEAGHCICDASSLGQGRKCGA